jgi:diguanylate cyclase (GGDEF)-like protein
MALAVEAMILSVGLTQRISDLRIQRDLNAKRADFDPITMLPNRQHIRSQGQKLFARARKRKTTLAVMFLDIDHFKRINDTYGHATGDEVLCTVANRCRGALRSAELMGRYGGDEFIVFFPGGRPGDPEIIGRRLVDFVGATPVATSEGESIAVTISAGVALLEPTTTSLDELVELADKALYDAKGSGRDRLTMSGNAGG